MSYKIITKIMVEILKVVLPNLISTEKDGFVQKRQIMDGIIMMHKTLHSINVRK